MPDRFIHSRPTVGRLQPGTVVGDLEVLGLVGRGGMAEVWRVRHRAAGTVHALKVLHAASDATRHRLLLEGRAQAGFAHPNLLRVDDIVDVHGQPALLMPYIDGPSLAELLGQAPPPPDEALGLFVAITDGLAAAHGAGLVHRDLKPSNVLLDLATDRVVPRIVDFGLVKHQDLDSTMTGEVFGTPRYAAPEQLRDASAADHRADVFSLGALLVELLSGHRPFAGQSIAQLTDAHRDPPDLSGVPSAIRPLAAAMLAIVPTERPPSCAAVLARLPARGPTTLGPESRTYLACRRLMRDRTDLAPDPSPSSVTATLEPRASDAPHNLPAPGETVGRGVELSELDAAIAAGARLVTLVGPGGVGKTHLAQVAGRRLLGRFAGGVRFCDLSDARDDLGILAAVGRALDAPLGKNPVAQLVEVLRGTGRVLLVLDNFEQVVAHGEATVGRWLAGTTGLVCLVTSQRPLRLADERVLAVEPFGETHGVELFARRVRAATGRPLPDEDRPVAAEVVRLLDGLPLAIELAAARARLLSPAQMRARLADRFRLLRSRGPAANPRQRTLRAALQWSWDLLSATEQAALAQLAVFEDGFTLAHAEAVVVLDDDDVWLADVLDGLVDKSLVRAHRDGADARLSLLLSVRGFAAEKLADHPERDGAERRHGAVFAGLYPPEAVALVGVRTALVARARPQRELANLLAAHARAVARDDGDTAVRCLYAAWTVWDRTGPFEAAVALAEATLGVSGARPGTVHRLLGVALHRVGRLAEASAAAHEALARARANDDALLEGAIRTNLGLILGGLGEQDAAFDHLARARVLLEAVDDPLGVACAVQLTGMQPATWSRPDEARALLDQARTNFRALGDPHLEAIATVNLGLMESETGNLGRAVTLIERGLALARQEGAPRVEAAALQNLGTIRARRGELEAAELLFQRALEAHTRLGYAQSRGIALMNLGCIARDRGELAVARGWLDRSARVLARVDAVRPGLSVAMVLGEIDRREGRLADGRSRLMAAMARAEQIGDHGLLGMIRGTLGGLLVDLGEFDAARAHLAAAEAHQRRFGEASGLLGVRCHQAVLELRAGGDWREALAEAEALQAEHQLPPHTVVGERLAEAHALRDARR